MDNFKLEKNPPMELDDDALDNISGGAIGEDITDCQANDAGDSSDTGIDVMSGCMLR